MALFLSLYLGHILGDFVFQPGKLVVAKRAGLAGVLLHTAIVFASTALVVLGDLAQTWPAVALAAATHFAVEHLSVRARRAADTSNLAVFLLDQGIHVVSLALLAMYFAPAVTSPVLIVWPVSLGLLATVCGIATVAFFGSILVFEIEISDAATTHEGDPLLGLDAQRLYGMVERSAALGMALLLPVAAFGILAFVPRLVYASASPTERKQQNLIAAIAGLGLCTLVWALVLVVSGA